MAVDMAQAFLPAFWLVAGLLCVVIILVVSLLAYANFKNRRGFFTTLWMSFFPSKYAVLKDRQVGWGIWYYFLVSTLYVLAAVALTALFVIFVLSSVNSTVTDVTITAGVVTLEQDPFEAAGIIYMSAADFDPETRNETILLTKNKLIVRDELETKSYDLSKIESFNLASFMQQFVGPFTVIMAVLGVLGAIVGLMIYHLLYFLFAALLLLLNNPFFNRRLSYLQYLNMALYSNVPVWIITLVLFSVLRMFGMRDFTFWYTIIHVVLVSWVVSKLGRKRRK